MGLLIRENVRKIATLMLIGILVLPSGVYASTYHYNHTNQRVLQIDNENVIYTPNKHFERKGNTSTKHIYVDGILIGSVETDEDGNDVKHFIHIDHLGGTHIVSDEDGNAEQALDYFPYGNPRINDTQGYNESNKFTGYELDGTGLQYAGQRYYDGSAGRFNSQDPISFDNPEQLIQDPQALNMYGYSRNNPLQYIDPDGAMFLLAPSNQQRLYSNPSQAEIQRAKNVLYYTGGISPADTFIDVAELASGRQLNTDESLTYSGRVVSGVFAFLPFVSGGIVRKGVEYASPVLKSAEDMAESVAQAVARSAKRTYIKSQLGNASGKLINGKVRIPEGWVIQPAKTKGGFRYIDPGNPSEHIRLVPKSKTVHQPYMKIHRGNSHVDINGRPVDTDSPQAHIRIDSIQ